MDADAVPAPGRRSALSSSSWAGVGAVGIVLFAIGIYVPALRGVPDADVLRVLLAVAGGGLAAWGLPRAWETRRAERHARERGARPQRPRGLDFSSSLEIYDPGAPGDRTPPPAESDRAPRDR
jgi:hypothetical protein